MAKMVRRISFDALRRISKTMTTHGQDDDDAHPISFDALRRMSRHKMVCGLPELEHVDQMRMTASSHALPQAGELPG
jgi:hypothetical protein